MKIFITGAAGFIGFSLVDRILNEKNSEVVGLDVINDYYDINIKYSRLSIHGINGSVMKNRDLQYSVNYSNYKFLKADLADHDFIVNFIISEKFDYVINLAAQAGVRFSIDNPRMYLHSNVNGFLSVLEGCRHAKVKHLVYASTSSVYGLNTEMPLSENQNTDHPISFYSATKKSNELMAHTYSHLFEVPTTGLRFFTVYGPWGRPDMALFLFTNSIINNMPINVYNHGRMIRDFTFVKDIVESIFKILPNSPVKNPNWSSIKNEPFSSSAPYRIFNIGNNNPVKLMDYINTLEICLDKKAKINFLDMQPGDVKMTNADSSRLYEVINFKPSTSIKDGIEYFVKWYKEYYKI